ncbi:GGDEF domain-containing protein [Microbulbifer salipaludis]|uniref:diguanylate cyclase n=2 Tax=Microbulbifer salipaludis TaxID=187980 RepID=A0ABS3E4I1_9GAMM|nr:diguanylate cyclase [Microbulbifer salipaludis]MBN8430208.1 GGDEF domain-containing protein [Microbulbifer salipaludis]
MEFARWVWGVALIGLSLSAGASPFVVGEGQRPQSLTPYLQILVDEPGKLELQDVWAASSQRWQSGVNASFGFSEAAYWVAITLQNTSDAPMGMIIRQDYPLIDQLDFWQPSLDGGWRHTATGDRRPFDSRPLNLRDFVFPITLPANTTHTFYLRYQTAGSMNIGLSVSSETAFLPQLGKEQILLGIYYGGFLVLVIYNLFLFLAVRDRAYAYYMGYAISYGLYFGVHNGVYFQYLWPGNPWLANQSLLILLGLTLIFGIQFVRTICSGPRLAPRTDRVARWVLYALFPLTAIAPFVDYGPMIVVLALLTLMLSILFMVMGVISLLRGSVPARYFLVGWAALLVSVVIYMLKTFGLVPHNGFTHNAFQVGALVEMVLLSLALGARVGEIQRYGYTDQLTTLFNRRYFDERLAREFTLAARSGTPLALLILDLDHFKAINDRLGHVRGDDALCAVGQLLRKQVRKPVLACRYGGEEFAILLPRTDREQASAVAGRLLKLVSELALDGISLSASIGIATFEQQNFASAMQLIEAADAALYRAKQSGRNRFELAQCESDVNAPTLAAVTQ